MTMAEWFTEYRFHEPKNNKFAGSLTQDDVDELLELMDE